MVYLSISWFASNPPGYCWAQNCDRWINQVPWRCYFITTKHLVHPTRIIFKGAINYVTMCHDLWQCWLLSHIFNDELTIILHNAWLRPAISTFQLYPAIMCQTVFWLIDILELFSGTIILIILNNDRPSNRYHVPALETIVNYSFTITINNQCESSLATIDCS